MKKKLFFLSAMALTSLSLKAQNVFTAIESKDAQAVKFLLNKGNVDVNAKDANGSTALINAVKTGQDRIVKLLLEKDANIDIKDKTGNTALMYACTGKHDEELYYMVSHYPNLDVQDNDGATALIKSATIGNTAAVKILLAYGAKADIKDKNDKTASDYIKQSHPVMASKK